MGFRRKVDHHIEAFLGEEAMQETFVTYISMNETMPIRQTRGEVLKICEVPRIGEGVQVDNPPILPLFENMANEVRADKSGPPGDQKVSFTHATSLCGWLIELLP